MSKALTAFAAGVALAGSVAILALRRKVKPAAAAAADVAVSAPSPTPQPLAGKVAVVTGASSGIGRAVAQALHAAGARVAIGARRKDKLDELCAELGGERVVGFATDVTRRGDVEALVGAAEARFGAGVDVLVNVAGVMYFTLMKNCKFEEWDRTVDVNCKGVLHGFGAVLPGMVSRGVGHIITVSSDAGRRVFPSLAVYCASKYFVEALSEATRRELIGTGVRVTTIQPGDTATDLVRNNTDAEACDALGVKIGEVVGEGWANQWQLLHPADVADAVLFAATAAPHVAINEVLVEPRDQA